MKPYYRVLFCPICGASVRVNLESTVLPEVHRLPEHPSANGANVCAALVVTVTLALDQCSECGDKMTKHPTGLCLSCFGRVAVVGGEG